MAPRPQQNAPHQNGPDQIAPDQIAPDQNAPDQNAPDQKAPDQNAPRQSTPRRIMAEPALAALTGWLRRAREVLAESAPAIDAINVFPAPDADTGTNVTLTLTGIGEAVSVMDRADLAAVGRAAVVSAHGNSGAVVGQMIAVAVHRLAGRAADEPCGRWIAGTLCAATDAATAAVADPVRGTILSVAEAAASAAGEAAEAVPADGLEVARAARRAAAVALDRTTEQLAPLRAAGVVDAGGLAYLQLLDVLVEVLGGDRARPLPAPDEPGRIPTSTGATHEGVELYEVMYLVTGADPAELDRLRARLSGSADSVVVVTDRTSSSSAAVPTGTAQVHAHLARPELAIAPGLEIGTVSDLRVTPLLPPERSLSLSKGRREPLVIIEDPAYADLVRTHGGRPLPARRDDDAGLTARIAAKLAELGETMIIVAAPDAAASAGEAIAACPERIELLEVGGPIEALCALAVHEPTAPLTVTSSVMRAAAGRVRTGAIHEGHPDLIIESGWQMITGDGTVIPELITIISATQGEPAATELARRAAETYPGAEVELLDGGQSDPVLMIGVEP